MSFDLLTFWAALSAFVRNVSFAWPWVFGLLLLPLAFRYLAGSNTRKDGLRLPLYHVLIQQGLKAKEADASTRSWVDARNFIGRMPALCWLAWGLLILAAARPQWAEVRPLESSPLSSGRDILLVLDLSASMGIRDLVRSDGGEPVSRLAASQQLGLQFMARRPGDRIGVIVFGSQPYLYTPLTYDLRAAGEAISALETGLAGKQTALGDALALGVKTLAGDSPLPPAEGRSRVMVLISDGASNAGELSPQQAAWLASRAGVSIHVVGVGGAGELPKENAGQKTAKAPTTGGLDENALRGIAARSGGHYARATAVADLKAFFDRIDTLEPALTPQQLTSDLAERNRIDGFRWPLALALILLAALVLPERVMFRRQLPSAKATPWPATAGLWQSLIAPELLPHLLVSAKAMPSPFARWLMRRYGWLVAGSFFLPLLALLLPSLIQSSASNHAEMLRPDRSQVLMVEMPPAFDQLPDEARQQFRARFRAFVRQLPRGETSLALVAGDAWLVVPPTEDPATFDVFIAELSSAAMPAQGLNRERGVELATRLLEGSGATQRVIYWWAVPDLGTTSSVGAIGFKMSAIDAKTSTKPVFKDFSGESGVSAYFLQVNDSFATWQTLTAESAADTDSWRNSVLNLSVPNRRGELGYAFWILLLGVLVAALAGVACDLRRAGDNDKNDGAPLVGIRTQALLAAVVLILVFQPMSVWAGKEKPLPEWFARGEAAYRAARYEDAARAFEEGAETDAAARHNQGNALARTGRLQEALAAYDASLRQRPDNADTRFNRDLVARLLQSPPPPSSSPPPPSSSSSSSPSPNSPPPNAAEQEAARVAEQWLRKIPATPPGLLKRKLALEEARRSRTGASEPPLSQKVRR